VKHEVIEKLSKDVYEKSIFLIAENPVNTGD